jgi:hypothetical protein
VEKVECPGRDIQTAEVSLARHLSSLFGRMPLDRVTWVRVSQSALEYLQWELIQRACGDYLSPHENVHGAINNLRQVQLSTHENYTSVRKMFADVFAAYVRVTNRCECQKWTIEKQKQLDEFERLAKVLRIELPDDVKEILTP